MSERKKRKDECSNETIPMEVTDQGQGREEAEQGREEEEQGREQGREQAGEVTGEMIKDGLN